MSPVWRHLAASVLVTLACAVIVLLQGCAAPQPASWPRPLHEQPPGTYVKPATPAQLEAACPSDMALDSTLARHEHRTDIQAERMRADFWRHWFLTCSAAAKQHLHGGAR
jgi:hypothetical protein